MSCAWLTVAVAADCGFGNLTYFYRLPPVRGPIRHDCPQVSNEVCRPDPGRRVRERPMIGVRTSSTATTPVDRRLASRTVSGSIVGAAPMRRRCWSDLDQRRVAVGCSNLCASAASAHRTDVGVRTFVPLRAPDPLRAVVWVPASTQKPPQTAAARHRGETWCRADGRAGWDQRLREPARVPDEKAAAPRGPDEDVL